MILLDIKNMTIELETPEGLIRAVDKVNLTIREGEIRGLVGESGSGKSLIAKAIVGVLNKRWHITADRFSWAGQDLLRLSYEEQRKIIGRDIAMIYQEPSRSMDPTAPILDQLLEAIPDSELTGSWWGRPFERRKKAIALLHKVGIRDHQAILNSYPYQLPEGVCQKIMIAMAIAKKPKLLIADEPTTALESTTQAQLFRLLASFNQLKGMSILLISHELETVARNTQTLSVLYCGQLVEAGETAAILKSPFHPYTDALIKSVPEFQPQLVSKQPLYALHGSIPTLQHLPIGCRLGPRCPNARKECVKTPVPERLQNHYFSCHFPLQGKKS
ncbi:MAG: ATP-binding cassette domain-containing protein [Gammaproteobacteria bacterium]|nr:ATP-binding cassette domain-containing protein [Gammaproteobacteria bacterium]MBU2056750.1 ATP-binding cassette domain-containing protein [Gammaproteobacteria bacterium]MBU2174087.1 ATP-binding cassette domain-containing protein [Gammaproteobacteria bacterium]MBU2247007.1 ATP-binding cassette domain-containing protein [Gammaproteobacteria bacterium]MBU2343378.1 ATP-binding cassette domain-containing protein [Gammaproteobacteria bacterium]